MFSLSKNKIIVKFKGGLGNQLFQYSFGKYLSSITQKELLIDDSYYHLYPKVKGVTLRYFELDNFSKINEKRLGPLFLKKILPSSRFSYYLFQIIQNLIYSPIDISETFDLKKLVGKKNIICDGYFQKIEYPNANLIELKDLISIQLDSKGLEFKEEVENCNSISVHIRRTDYLETNNSKLGLAINLDYYLKAVNFLSEKVNKPKFFIFSDDIEWCKENLNYLNVNNLVFVESSPAEFSYKDMVVMSLCKHNIIANSTFSWWGAWLNKNTNKIVVCPRNWNLVDSTIDLKILDKNWVTL